MNQTQNKSLENCIEANMIILDQQASHETFVHLYKKYKPDLQKKINHLLGFRYVTYGDDLLQETFYKIFLYLGKYDPSRSGLYTWMVNIARNTTIDFLRSKYAKSISREQPIPNAQDLAVLPSFTWITRIDVMAMINHLSKQEANIVQLKYLYGLTGNELAVEMGIPVGTIKTKIRTILLKLKNYN